MLVLKRADLEEQLEDNLARLAAVEHRLHHIDKENDVLTDAIVKHIPDLHIATVRIERREHDFNDLGPSVGPALAALTERLGAAGVRHEGPVFLHYETADDDTMVVNVAVPVGDQAVPADDLIHDVVLPAIDVVATIHHGGLNHDEIGPIYGQLARWAEDHGHTPLGLPGRDLLIDIPPTPDLDGVSEHQLPITPA